MPADSNRKLYPREWLEVVTLAKEGVSPVKIAETFKVSPSTIYRGLAKRKVRVGAYRAPASELEAKKDRDAKLERIRKAKDQAFTVVDFLEKEVVREITSAKAAGVDVGSKMDNVKTLKMAIDAINNGTAVKWKVLGLDKDTFDAEEELPELPIREMSRAEIELLRASQEIEDEGGDIDDEAEELPDPDEVIEGLEDSP